MDPADRAVAPDGSPVILYRTIPGEAEAALIHDAIPAGSSILELGCGAGRVTRHLVALGHRVTGVDNSADMLAHIEGIDDVEGVLADITTLDLSPRHWPVVLAASHLVNDELGPSFLAAGARHLEPRGCLLVQRHEPGWIDAVEDSTRHLDGLTATIRVVDRPRPGVVTAAMVYELEGSRFEQPFTAYEVDNDRLADLAAPLGCVVDAVLDDRRTWVRLRRE
jgi:SAM-dependent methyltransferase